MSAGAKSVSKTAIVIALSLFIPASLVSGQSTVPGKALCDDEMTIELCGKKIEEAFKKKGKLPAMGVGVDPEALEKAKKKAEKEGKEAVLKELQKRLPSSIAAFPSAATRIPDLLSKVGVSLATVNVGESDKTALAFELGNFFGLREEAGYKVDLTLRPAELHAGIAKVLDEEQETNATKKLGDFDDLLLSFSWAPKTGRLKMAELSAILVEESAANLSEALSFASDKRARVFARISEASGPDAKLFDPGTGEFVAKFEAIVDADLRQDAIAVVQEAKEAELEYLFLLSSSLKRSGYFALGELAANDPQFVFEGSYSIRDDFVGPDELALKVSYQLGLVNLSRLRKECRKEKKSTDSDGIGMKCLEHFMTPDVRKRLDASKGDALSFSAEYMSTEDLDVTTAGGNVMTDSVQRWSVQVEYGRNLVIPDDGKVSSRFDLSGRWEDWSDDPMHQDRGVLEASLSQRLTDDFSAVVGVVWASKPEFRGEVDAELSVRAGFTFKIDE